MQFNKKIIKYVSIAVVLLAIIWIVFIRSNSRFSNLIFKISAPLVKIGNSIYSVGRPLFIIGKINRENIALSRENNKLIAENAKLNELERENAILKNMLDIPILKNKNILRADIVGFNPFASNDLLVINKGEIDGVKNNLPVISEEGILLGRVESVADNYSKILLIFSSRSSVAALSQQTRSSGIIKGNFGTSLILDMVPQLDSINENDLLITSGIGGIFPKGIPIGKVGEIDSSANEVFKKASVKALVDLHKLENAVVILN